MVRELDLLPVFQVVITILTFILCYIWSVLRHDVDSVFPFISDTGANSPESCLFSQLLNVSAFLTLFIMYARYKSVEARLAEDVHVDHKWLTRLSKGSTVIGMLAAFGVSLVANFQDNSELSAVHFTGAVLAFGPGVLYCLLQSVLSYLMCPRYNTVAVCRVRLAITVFCIAAAIVMAVSWITASQLRPSDLNSHKDLKWKPEYPGYTAHLFSTAFEWILSCGFFCFFLTYIGEFNKLELNVTARLLAPELDLEIGRARQLNGIHNVAGRRIEAAQPSINAPDFGHGSSEEAGERTRLLNQQTQGGGAFV
ncbi:DNA damage-regulated autophagy modulator protein 2 [Plakobranchus ocellatus]|uniref:DNA damage-regulated autophagy modulator protein 2 n=1 Tax=Plakobranchus ocellatus TaxID=259542 RepID=A0AAV4D614_9GAST|nr:DNA damage-regulated autophagy modulator protein 2 [Plakobranchus ocellatus]